MRWIEPDIRTILKQDRSTGYWLSKVKSARWKIWSGYAFESVCYKHIAQIRKALYIEVRAAIGSWRYATTKAENQGAQIDLLFDRDNGANVQTRYRFESFSANAPYRMVARIKVIRINNVIKKFTNLLYFN